MAAERASKPRVLLIPPATQASRVTHVINDRFSLVLFLKKKKKTLLAQCLPRWS